MLNCPAKDGVPVTDDPRLSVDILFDRYREVYRPTYAHADSDVSEQLAFMHGMIAASVLLQSKLGDMIVTTHGNSVEWELNQALARHQLNG